MSQSDSQAPDHTEALLGDEGSQMMRNKKRQEQEDEFYFPRIKSESQQRTSSQLLRNDDPEVSYEETVRKDNELTFGTSIRNEKDSVYDEIVELTPLQEIIADPKRSDVIPEDVKELIPTDTLLSDHQDDECVHAWTQKTDDAKAVIQMANDYIMPDVTDDVDGDITLKVARNEIRLDNSSTALVGFKQQSLLLNRNASSSCFIDAPFELLLRSILPYIKDSFLNSCDRSNSFDNVFQQYEEGKSIVGNQMIRNFTWTEETLYSIGQMDDVYFFFEWFLQGISAGLHPLVSFCSIYQMSICTESEQHVFIDSMTHDLLSFIRDKYPSLKGYCNVKKVKGKNELNRRKSLL
ncbi:hypothetical protein [Parasitella parasitica]|uniref:Uncharacterized protein n=1 Tax=Parasitella parasitica TaxID=35722 RepID=A0A0B7NNP7_9FUNG|nr:hypothetical protein [Parasitella parasitica]